MQCDAKRQDGAQCEDDFGHYGSHVWPKIKFAANVTLRDYFAAMALQGQIAAFSDERCRAYSVENSYEAGITPKEQVAVAAYEYADAMLKAREAN